MFNKIDVIYHFYAKQYKKRFLYCFSLYFLLVIFGAIIGVLNPSLTTATVNVVGEGFQSSFPGLFQAIGAGQIIIIILTIFGINSIFGSFLTITLPNIVGLGTLTFITRPLLWGLIYAPINPPSTILLIIVLPTLILEGVAYVIAFTSSIDLLLALIKPSKLDEKSRWKAFKKAWIFNLKSYVLILIVLFVAAVVETFTIGLIKS